MRKKFFILLKIGISFSLIYLVITRIDGVEVLSTLRSVHPGILLLAFLIFVVAHYLNTFKWQILLKVLSISEDMGKLFELHLIGIFYTMFLPGGQLTGEAVKAYRTKNHLGQTEKIVASILVDRVTGLFPFLVLGVVGASFSSALLHTEGRGGIFVVFWISIVVLSLAGILFHKSFLPMVSRLQKLAARLNTPRFIRGTIHKVLEVISAYAGKSSALLAGLLFGFLFQILNILVVYFLAYSIGTPISIFDIMWVYSLVSVILILPVSIMGLGQREVSFIFLLGLVGVSGVVATSLSVLIFIFALALGVLGGIIEGYHWWIRDRVPPVKNV